VAGGSASVALVVAYSKPSESDIAAYYSTLAEPFYQRPVGIDHLVVAGLMANQYLTHSGAKDEDLVDIAAHAWRHAAGNPYVETPVAISADDVRGAQLVADPLTGLQIARPMDGAVAVLIANERVARRLTPRPVWITGMGSAMDSQFLAERAPGRLEACAAAATAAYARAGVTDPGVFGLAEVSGASAAAEAMVVEALGLAAPGHAVERYSGDGPLDLNPSGGAIPADPVMATGLVRLHEASARLGGRSEQESTASAALVHGAGGLGMQNHCVFTLEV